MPRFTPRQNIAQKYNFFPKKITFAAMLSTKKYIFNIETLSYELEISSKRTQIAKCLLLTLGAFLLVAFYWWLYIAVLGYDLPKTAYLKQVNEGWGTRIELIDRNLKDYSQALELLQMRDDHVYRSLFGMDPISREVRNAGFGGVNRYSYLDDADRAGLLKNTMIKLDVMTKKSYVQSKSYDEVEVLARRAGEMASCIPNISPIIPDPNVYRLSSGYGMRNDPITGKLSRHLGLDFAMPVGNSVYSTGDGVVTKVNYGRVGYGNFVIVDHGFGYKTRYAHMSSIFVEEGMKVKRGDFIGKTGNSGKSSGPHLHYEVIYKDSPINPINYVDLEIPVNEYNSMVRHVEAESSFAIHPSHRRKK